MTAVVSMLRLLLTSAMLLAVGWTAVKGVMRTLDAVRRRACREVTTGEVVDVHVFDNNRKASVTYEYDIPDDDGTDGTNQDEEDGCTTYVDSDGFNPRRVWLSVGDKLTVYYDPDDPENIYVPVLEDARTETGRSFLVSQVLRLVIALELALMLWLL